MHKRRKYISKIQVQRRYMSLDVGFRTSLKAKRICPVGVSWDHLLALVWRLLARDSEHASWSYFHEASFDHLLLFWCLPPAEEKEFPSESLRLGKIQKMLCWPYFPYCVLSSSVSWESTLTLALPFSLSRSCLWLFVKLVVPCEKS